MSAAAVDATTQHKQPAGPAQQCALRLCGGAGVSASKRALRNCAAPSAAGRRSQRGPLGEELKQAIRRQVEFYFSKANLATDAFLVSQMNSQMYVAVDVVASFSKVQQLTKSTAQIVDAIRDSSVVSLNDAGDAIKPNLKSERNTIILREIPSATPPAEVEAIFGGNVVSVRSDVGDTWFVTMASEEAAVNTLLALRSKKFNDAPIKARLKSENTLKSFFPTQPTESAVAPGGAYSSRGYYGAAPVGYYDVPNNYGVQYHAVNNARAPYSNGAVDSRYTTPRGGRSAAASGGAYRQHNQGDRGAAPQQQKGDSKAAEQQPRSAPSAASKKSKAEKKAAKQAAAAPASNGSAGKKAAAAPAAERQPILSSSNFPPLPTGEKPSDAPIQHTYHHEDIMEIVKHMDENDCTLPAGKMDFDVHPAALTAVAHPDLLRNQRTYSIEQAREAMRQGRPIRSDSVGSIDYESMMYGEDYTKEARELRKQNSDGAVAAGADTKSAAPAAPKVFSFASAVIHGTPAPADAVAAKKKPAAAAAPASAEKALKTAAKDDKKAGKKAGKAAETKVAAVDETLPKAGAWGGRNFLDVVKSEPAAVQPPAAPVKAAAAPAKDVKPQAAK